METVKIFTNPIFGNVRVTEINGDPFFVGKDVAIILGYAKPENAISAHVDEDDKTSTLIRGNGSNYKSKTILINESGVYSLVFSSKLPMAKSFKHWITSDVIPSIRKYGLYAPDDVVDKMLNDPDTMIKTLQAYKNERQKRIDAEQTIIHDAPKVMFADSVATSKQSCLIGELAKILKQNGIEIGEKRLFQWLRDKEYLCKFGERYNQPTQRSMEMSLFELKKTSIQKPDGSILVNTTTKVTGSGQIYFVNKFLSLKSENA